MVATFAITALVGLCIGVLAGMLGLGGGMFIVPTLRLGFGLSALASTATSLFTIIPTSISGAIAHIRAKTCAPKIGLALGLGGACLSPVGVHLAQASPSWLVMLMTGIVIAYTGITMAYKALKMPKEQPGAAKASTAAASSGGSSVEPAAPSELDAKRIALAVGIGAVTGVASGYVGLGGGFIMVPLMLSLMNMPMKLVSGTSLIAIMILATPGAIAQCMLGNVDYLAGIALACGSIPGAQIGARLMKRTPERTLRFIFSGLLIIAAVALIAKETGFMG